MGVYTQGHMMLWGGLGSNGIKHVQMLSQGLWPLIVLFVNQKSCSNMELNSAQVLCVELSNASMSSIVSVKFCCITVHNR